MKAVVIFQTAWDGFTEMEFHSYNGEEKKAFSAVANNIKKKITLHVNKISNPKIVLSMVYQ